MAVPLGESPFGHTNFQNDLDKLRQAKDSLRSIEGVTLSSEFDQEKVKYVKVEKGKATGMFQTESVLVKLQRFKDGHWRVQLENLKRIQNQAHTALAAVTEDAHSKKTPLDDRQLTILKREVENINSLIEGAKPHLENLKQEFRKYEKESKLTKTDAPAKFEKEIDTLIEKAKEDLFAAKVAIDGRLAQLPPSAPRYGSEAASAAASPGSSSPRSKPPSREPPVPPPLRDQSPPTRPSRVFEDAPASPPKQGLSSLSEAIGDAGPRLKSPQRERPMSPGRRPASPRQQNEAESRPTSPIKERAAPSISSEPPRTESPPPEPAKPKAPDLDHYHHPIFRGLPAFKDNDDYKVRDAETSTKKTLRGAAPKNMELEQRTQIKRIKTELEQEANAVQEKYEHRQKAFRLVEGFLADLDKTGKAAANASTSSVLPSGSSPMPKGPPPPPPSIKGPPPPPPKGKLPLKGAGVSVPKGPAARPAEVTLDPEALKLINAVKARADFIEAKKEIIGLLFPEFAHLPDEEFTQELIEQALKTFLKDVETVKRSTENVPAAASAPAAKVDNATSQAVEAAERSRAAILKIQIDLRKLHAAILKNEDEVRLLNEQINRRSRDVKGTADTRQIQSEVLDLGRRLQFAEERVAVQNPQINLKIKESEEQLKKEIKTLQRLIISTTEDPAELLKEEATYVTDVKAGKITPKERIRPQVKGLPPPPPPK